MRKFENILFVSHGIRDETTAIKQALRLVAEQSGVMDVLIIRPALPSRFAEYKETYEESLIDRVRGSIRAVETELMMKETAPPIKIRLAIDISPATQVINHVLRNEYDIVIKEAEPTEGKGYLSIDMDLLRQCPCPLWICRPDVDASSYQVGVAIDPETSEGTGRDLSKKLLKLSSQIANSRGAKLHIISCWDFLFEGFLSDNTLVEVPTIDIANLIKDTGEEHKEALLALIKESDLTSDIDIHHMRGLPSKVISEQAEIHKIDTLVMGTVARTGLENFIMGNTAEDIIKDLRCSLLALKPNGFVTPVKIN